MKNNIIKNYRLHDQLVSTIDIRPHSRGYCYCGGEEVKPIRLSAHAKEQLFFRGVTEEEVVETIRTSQWQSAELKRLECRKDFIFEKVWNKRYYKTKQVRPIFVEEEKEIVIITVYTYFF